MKHQALFSSEDKCKAIKCRLLQFLFGALRVKSTFPPCQLDEMLMWANWSLYTCSEKT